MPSLSPTRIAADVRRGAAAGSSAERGQCLEDLITYVLSRVPGLRFSDSRVRTTDGSEEVDVVFWNDKMPGGFPFADHVLLIECKNWNSRVGSDELHHFDGKLHQRHLRIGLLVAALGVTGDETGRAATALIERYYVVDSVTIVVITHDDLRSLRSTDALVRLVQDRISKIVLQAAG